MNNSLKIKKTVKNRVNGGQELVSVIVPVFNVEKYVEKCVNTILNQTYKNLEIILIDDGSTDSSGKICDEYAEKDERITVIHKENGGLSSARNAGLSIVTGGYITYIDSDDYVSKEYVEVLYQNLRDNNADIAIGSFRYVYEGDTDVEIELKEMCGPVLIWNNEETLYHMLLQRNITTSAWGVLSRREYWSDVKFPKGKLFEDMGTSYKIYAKANKVVFVNQIIYYYMMRHGSIQNTSFNIKKMDELEMVTQCKNFIDERYPRLREATTNRLISCCFHMLFSMNDFGIEEGRKLVGLIKQYRRKMVFGRTVNKKVRFGCLCTYLGFDLTKLIYEKMGMRGKINI